MFDCVWLESATQKVSVKNHSITLCDDNRMMWYNGNWNVALFFDGAGHCIHIHFDVYASLKGNIIRNRQNEMKFQHGEKRRKKKTETVSANNIIIVTCSIHLLCALMYFGIVAIAPGSFIFIASFYLFRSLFHWCLCVGISNTQNQCIWCNVHAPTHADTQWVIKGRRLN